MSPSLSILLLSLLCGTGGQKVAIAPMTGGDGTTPGMMKMLGEKVAAELRRQNLFDVMTYDELRAVLSHEQLRMLLGCTEPKCYSDVGKLVGTRALVTGSAGKVASSWLVTLKLIDVEDAQVLVAIDRRIEEGSADEVLDQLPGLVAELAAASVREPHLQARPASSIVVSDSSSRPKAAPAGQEELFEDAQALGRLLVLTDGKGHIFAYDPQGTYKGPFFAGSRRALYEQRIGGGGKSAEETWSNVFWEPRVRERWQAGFSRKGALYELQCSDRSIALEPADKELAEVVLTEATFYRPRWRRRAFAIARDDMGTYYYVDELRARDVRRDYRVFVGTKGNMEYAEVRDASVDGQNAFFVTDRGRLILDFQKKEAFWAVGSAKRALLLMNLYQQAPKVYSDLGVYDEPLGTACDPFLR